MLVELVGHARSFEGHSGLLCRSESIAEARREVAREHGGVGVEVFVWLSSNDLGAW